VAQIQTVDDARILNAQSFDLVKWPGVRISGLVNKIERRTTMTAYTHILDLAKDAEPPADGILSKTVFQDERTKAVLFAFGQGQELSEHTAAKPAMLYFVKGEASVGLGDDVQDAQAGTWIHMPANLNHSIKAKTPVVMLLVLLK
jgi:quercetin dioxygenase-like cupin family protein